MSSRPMKESLVVMQKKALITMGGVIRAIIFGSFGGKITEGLTVELETICVNKTSIAAHIIETGPS